MVSAIEQALVSLVPSFNFLPTDLVSLATALLAQSHAKAGNLKAEEEIARTYVCAHLACEKLKTRLSLDKLQSRPPVPPRVYKKLYTYLERLLTSPSTPTAQRHVDRIAKNNQSTARKGVVSTASTPRTGRQTPIIATTRTSARATPTYQGRGQETPALSATDRAAETRNAEVADSSDATGSDAENNQDKTSQPDELTGIKIGTRSGASRSSKTPLRRSEMHAPRPLDPTDDDDDVCPAGLRPGLGTMFQDALDWLSDEHAVRYEEWSRNALLKLDTMDRARPTVAVP